MQCTHAQHSLKGEDFISSFRAGLLLWVCVADGHGGWASARMCTERISAIAQPYTTLMDIRDNIAGIFATLHQQCRDLPGSSGTTLLCCVVDAAGEYVCANVGDTLCVHVTPTSYMYVTCNHRLQHNSFERKRLDAHVGFSQMRGAACGPPRLFPGGLACGRTIGDKDCPSASHEPFVNSGFLHGDDILVLATDGLWDALFVKSVCDVSRRTRSAKHLLKKCLSLNPQDDVTIAVVGREAPKKRSGFSFSRTLSGTSLSSSSDEDVQTVIRVAIP